MDHKRYGTIWELDRTSARDDDFQSSIVLTNDTLTDTISSKASNENEEFSETEIHVLKNPWKPADNIPQCKFKVSRSIMVEDGKVEIETGICAGVKDGKAILYDFFNRSDWDKKGMDIRELKEKWDKEGSFVSIMNFLTAGQLANQYKFDLQDYEDKTDYDKLLGLK